MRIFTSTGLEPSALVLSAGLRRKRGHDLRKVFRNKVANGQLTFDEHGKRRRLHAADGERRIQREPVSAGQVHAHQPVGAAAANGGVGEGVVVTCGAQLAQPIPDCALRQRRDPKPRHGPPAPRGLVDQPKDQLPLAPRICRADHGLDVTGVDHLAHDLELVARGLEHGERPLLGQHRQVSTPPALPLGPNAFRLRQADQVADGPSDHVAIAGQRALAAPSGAQRLREITPNGRLLGNYGDGHG